MSRLMNGEMAPEIELRDTDGETWRLSDFRGKMVCIHAGRGEFCYTTRGEFALWSGYKHIFEWMNCEMVLLVNGGREQHREFREQFKIRPRILIDEDGSVGETYGIYQPNCKGKNYSYYMAPSVFLIDAEGKVACYWILSGPRGRPHPECVIGVLAYAQHHDWRY